MPKKILIFSPLEIFKRGMSSALLEVSPNAKVEGFEEKRDYAADEFFLGVFHLVTYSDFLKIHDCFMKAGFASVFLCRHYNASMLEKIFDRKNSVVFKEDLTFDELKDLFNLIFFLGRAKPDDVRSRLPFIAEKMINIETLTRREKEILYLLAKGMTTYSISLCLNISVHTVRNHVNRIYSKLGVGDRVSAVMKAISLGLLSDFHNPDNADKEGLYDL